MNRLIRSIVRETNLLLFHDVPLDVIEKILFEAHKSDKLYLLEEESFVSGDEGNSGYHSVLYASLSKGGIIKYIEKNYLFKDSPEIIEYERFLSIGNDYIPPPDNYTSEEKSIFLNTLLKENRAYYKWEYGTNMMQIREISLS